MGHFPGRRAAGERETKGELDGARRGARGKAVASACLRLGENPGRMLGLKKIEILQRRGRDQRAVDGMEGKALLERVRSRLALVRLRQLILRMRQRVQLHHLLGEQHHNGEKQALQRASALIEEMRHRRILVQLGRLRYLQPI